MVDGMIDLSNERALPLGQRHIANDTASITAAEPASRVSLRADADQVHLLEKALGFELPKKPKATTGKDDAHALWIGPDEWYVYGPDDPGFMDRFKNLPDTVSAVDVAHRNTAIVISGTGARSVLAGACPHDLRDSSLAVGAATRTIFSKAEIILHRTGKDEYRLECWRSFSHYVWTLAADSLKLNAA
ncbi:MAG: sarcosine oxidase subunit gamma family protein [Pseudomonadota bacterium]